MSGDTDKLAQIEAWATSVGHPPGSMNYYVLALVEIARAARGLSEWPAWVTMSQLTRLSAALSALDGDT